MKWSEAIRLPQPLRDVRRLAKAPAQDWEELVRQREQAAREQGRREAEKALSEQLLRQRTEFAEMRRGILESLRRAVPQVIQDTESTLLRLTLESVQKVMAGLPISSDLVAAVVREALQQVEDDSEVIVQLHPDDLALLQNSGSELVATAAPPASNEKLKTAPEKLRFVPNAEVSRGGCLVQTRFGTVNATREAKLEQLTRTLCS